MEGWSSRRGRGYTWGGIGVLSIVYVNCDGGSTDLPVIK